MYVLYPSPRIKLFDLPPIETGGAVKRNATFFIGAFFDLQPIFLLACFVTLSDVLIFHAQIIITKSLPLDKSI